ncbi:MAG: thioesterase family protein, partial [Pseudomonadota bacterium]
GVASVIRANRWAPILGGGTVRFMRSLRLFDRYEVNTRLLGWDRRWFYLEHSFIDGRGRSAAVGVTRAGLRQRDGWVDACTVANAVHPGAISPEIPGHIHDWVDFEEAICLHSTGQFRPGKADIALREIN